MRVNKDSNRPHKPKPRRVDNKTKDPKDQQEYLQTPDEIREQLQGELQNYYYSQSSKCSSVSRKLILGMLATIWIFIYTDGKLTISNHILLYALVFCILYLIIDVLHYFLDSLSYHKEQYKLDEYKTTQAINRNHEPFMNCVNKRSYYFLSQNL